MQCPGQDSRYWDGEAIFEASCSKCGTTVEFFKDDSKRKCRKCGHEVLNPKIDFGCAAYCAYAEHCLGDLPPEMLAQKQELLIERVAIEAKKFFTDDFRKIGHASKAARFADKLANLEDGNKAVAVIAAYLHEIDSKNTTDILTKLGANEGILKEVGQIIDYHQSGTDDENINFKILHDSILIANLAKKVKESAPDSETQEVMIKLLTINGRKMAKNLLVP